MSLWCFLLSTTAETLTTSPHLGILGCAIMLLLLAACMNFIAPVRARSHCTHWIRSERCASPAWQMRYLAVMLLHEEIALHLDSQNQDCFNASPENSVQSQHLSHENSVGLHIDSQHNRPGCNAAGDCCFDSQKGILHSCRAGLNAGNVSREC